MNTINWGSIDVANFGNMIRVHTSKICNICIETSPKLASRHLCNDCPVKEVEAFLTGAHAATLAREATHES